MAEPILTLDKYNLLEVIGSGGMATVYKARITGPMGFEKLAAVKLLHTELGADKDVVAMFIDEARIGAHFSHPNVISVLDFGDIDNRYYMAMEYVDGCNLATLMKAAASGEAPPIPVESAACAICDVLTALSYVHEATDSAGVPMGIVHRDISPQNIIVGKDGRARVGDFGIATGDYRDSYTSAGVVKGKAAYMSPEQAAGRPLDARSDVASTALTMFAIISGRVPFSGDDTVTVLARAEQGLKAEALDEVGCPAALKSVLLKATAARLQDRYRSAADFKAALEAAIPDYEKRGRHVLRKMVGTVTSDEKKPKGGRAGGLKKTSIPRRLKSAVARTTGSSSSMAPAIDRTTLNAYRVAGTAAGTLLLVAAILAMLL